ncbi:SDR family NAD(P)-dependent oxidoreductase [Agromyces allii]|uniref:SDR family oxidoreductase n=1 Tax=Agromyces allii TaxID=393607 RepID=A0ABP5BZ51_9MICO|nr:SDR family NAD(P)-dependent oxidoreductase [Agromyces allii]
MTERTIVITGASDGIGAALARRLAERGDRLLLVGRSAEKLALVAEPLGAEAFVADFERLDDVRELARAIRERTDRIDVLANNAGGVFGSRAVTVDGHERTMQVDHDAGFLLTNLLVDVLGRSGATVVTTSSAAARKYGRLDLDDLDQTGVYDPLKAYGDAKLANILFTRGLHDRHRRDGIASVAVHPGDVASNFGRQTGTRAMRLFYGSPLARVLKRPDGGAAELLWAIDGEPDAAWASGGYYEARRPPRRPHPQQHDAALVDAFWAESARRVGLPG